MAAIWDTQVKGQCFSSHVTYLAGYVGFGERTPKVVDCDANVTKDSMLSPILFAQVSSQIQGLCRTYLRYAKGIPIFIIYRLQMNVRTKVALCFLMGLGVL